MSLPVQMMQIFVTNPRGEHALQTIARPHSPRGNGRVNVVRLARRISPDTGTHAAPPGVLADLQDFDRVTDLDGFDEADKAAHESLRDAGAFHQKKGKDLQK